MGLVSYPEEGVPRVFMCFNVGLFKVLASEHQAQEQNLMTAFILCLSS
jgi:hypothetical protein